MQSHTVNVSFGMYLCLFCALSDCAYLPGFSLCSPVCDPFVPSFSLPVTFCLLASILVNKGCYICWLLHTFEIEKCTIKLKDFQMFIDWQDEYSENVHSISSNLDIQFNLHQNSNVIFQKNRNNLIPESIFLR